MRLTLTVTVDLTDAQIATYCDEFGCTPEELPADVESYATTTLQDSTIGSLMDIRVQGVGASRPARARRR